MATTIEEDRAAIERSLGIPSVPAPSPPTPGKPVERKPIEQAVAELRGQPGMWSGVGTGLQRGIDIAAPIVLGTAGAAVGAPLGLVTAGVGAGLGAAGGSVASNITRPFLTPNAPMPSLSATARQAAGEFGLGLAGQGIGGTLERGFNRLVRGGLLASWVPPEAKIAQAVLQQGGSTLTPAQMSSSRTLDVAENFAEGSLLGGGKMQALKATQQPAIQKVIREYVDGMGQARNSPALGTMLRDAISGESDLFTRSSRQLYSEVDKLAQGISVDTTALVKRITSGGANNTNIQKVLSAAFPEGYAPALGVQATPSVNRIFLPGAVESRLYPAAPTSSSVPFMAAQDARARLLRIARSKVRTVEDRGVVETAKGLAGMLDESMDASATRLSPQATETWRAANAFYKQGAKTFHDTYIMTLMNKLKDRPEIVATQLLRPDNATALFRVQKAIPPETWKELQANLAQRLVRPDPATGVLRGQTFLQKMQSLGDGTLNAAFGPDVTTKLKELGGAMAFTQRGGVAPKGTPGKVVVQLLQAGAFMDMVSFNWLNKPASGAIILGPWALGKILSNPTAINWLTLGVRAEPGSKAMFRALGQLVTLVNTGD